MTDSKESPKVLALVKEVEALRTRLRDAQRAQDELREQMAPVERLKSEIRKHKQLREEAEMQLETSEAKVAELQRRVGSLLADLAQQRRETEKFQGRAEELERLCAELGKSERGSQAELFRAQERVQLSRVEAFNCTLAEQRAQEEREEALAKVHSKAQQLQALKAEWTVLSEQTTEVREELVEKRAVVNCLQKEHGQLRKEHLELQQSFAQQREALHGATAEVQALRERSEGLEAELQRRQEAEAQAKVQETTHEPEPSGNFQISLPAAPRAVAAPEGAQLFRSAMDDLELPGLANYLQREMKCLKSRRDYPRCAAARQMRGRILDGHSATLFS
ncbi:unnamed protein product [Effrenium voratum]|uniref:Uncharacterized protein n=1 Tax=Effrenium voratum TaxID=2562239 RepID=A0AA36I9H3_9DINO|nr:unnamed protein product [Effrenium voratum]CAJ1437239.1 unnamed protein product [Effrenium voratum]